jgi:hypothetical protein
MRVAWVGGAVGAAIAVAAALLSLLYPIQVTSELRDFGLLLGFEVAALSFALASLAKTTAKPDRERSDAPFVF